MVNQEGQLYTIEGVAASVLVLTTVYLVMTRTIVFTPAETHIYDMQLEQLGNDVLAVMDVNETWGNPGIRYPKSPLETFVENNQGAQFSTMFLSYSELTPGTWRDSLSFNASIVYRNQTTGNVLRKPFAGSEYNRENAVKVTRWVNINNSAGHLAGLDTNRNQTVLLEVLLWRG
jgi:hypothetical protein